MDAAQSKASPALLPQKRSLELSDLTFSSPKLPLVGAGVVGAVTPNASGLNGDGAVGSLNFATPSPLEALLSGNPNAFASPSALQPVSTETQVVNLEIPQAQVQGVLGAQAATIKAIRAISGAQCVIKQQHPRPDSAVLTITGTPPQVEKCRGLIVALVEGDPGKVPAVDALGAVTAAGVPSLTPTSLSGLPLTAPTNVASFHRGPRLAPTLGPLGVRPSGLIRPLGAQPVNSTGLLGTFPLSLPSPSSSTRSALPKPAGGLGSSGSLAAALGALSGSRPSAVSPLSLGLAGLTGAGAVDLTKIGSLAGLTGISTGSGVASAEASPGNAATAAAAAAAIASAADATGTGSITSLLSTLGSAGTAGGDPNNSLYTQLAAALQLSPGQPVAGLSELAGIPARKQEPAFDRDALASLAKQAQENQASEAAAAAACAAAAAATATAATATSAISEPATTQHAAVSTAEATAAVVCGDGMQVTSSASPAGPLQREAVGISKEMPGAPLSGTVAVLAALGGGPTQTAASTLGAEVSESEAVPTKKDSTSVLGILQHAQNNLARNRAGGARGGASGIAPKDANGAVSGGGSGESGCASAVTSQLESLTTKLQAFAVSPTTDAKRAVEREALATLPKLEPSRAAELVARVYAIENLRNSELLDAFARVLTPTVSKHSSPHLTRLTGTLASWTLSSGVEDSGKVRLSEDLRNFFGAITTEVGLRLMDVQPADMARIATALASLGLAGHRLFASLARAAVVRSDRFATHELVSLVGAFDKARVFNTALLEALAKCLKTGIRDVSPKDVLRGMKALAAGGLRDEELAQIVGDSIPKRAASGGLSAEDFCSLAWTFCALDLHHDRLFRAVFRALEDASVVGSETLCQLYEIHLTLKAFHYESYKAYELEDDTAQSLRDHYKRHKGGSSRHQKLERGSEKVHADIAEVLREVVDASVSVAHQTTLGFIVDAAVLRKRGSSSALVMVDVDGPGTMLRSLDPVDAAITGSTQTARVRGGVALKRRLLQKHGGKVTVVNEDDWAAIDSNQHKREHLRDMLLKAGLNEDRLR